MILLRDADHVAIWVCGVVHDSSYISRDKLLGGVDTNIHIKTPGQFIKTSTAMSQRGQQTFGATVA